MNTKKYRSIVYSGAWIFLILVLAVSMGFVNNTRKQSKCSGLSIVINNEQGNYFVDEDDIRDYIYESNGDPIGQEMKTIDLANLELNIKQMEVVRNAEVYADLKGHIHIEVEQRTPIARVYFNNGKSAYMDEIGDVMPLSSKYTSRVIVINGAVPLPVDISNVDVKPNPDWQNVYALVNAIRLDDFFKAQFEQIYINSSGEYELTPRVGRHSILLGKGEDIDQKLMKLKLFYKEGISKVDWNKYKQIDLRFNNQIVCAKR
jgi:cell division protein FtsQ